MLECEQFSLFVSLTSSYTLSNLFVLDPFLVFLYSVSRLSSRIYPFFLRWNDTRSPRQPHPLAWVWSLHDSLLAERCRHRYVRGR